MTTTIPLPQLDQIRISKPCPARWEDMRGDDVRRFCSLCNLHVTNLSAMTSEQAEAFIASASERQEGPGGERVCVRLFRRADGTVITKDCPVGVSRARAAAIRLCGRAAAVLGLSAVAACVSARTAEREYFNVAQLRPVRWLASVLHPTKVLPIAPCRATMGDMAMGKIIVPTQAQAAPQAPSRSQGAAQ